MTNSAMAAAEAAHLREADWNYCDQPGCPNDAEPGSALCARHEDDEYDYACNDTPEDGDYE